MGASATSRQGAANLLLNPPAEPLLPVVSMICTQRVRNLLSLSRLCLSPFVVSNPQRPREQDPNGGLRDKPSRRRDPPTEPSY